MILPLRKLSEFIYASVLKCLDTGLIFRHFKTLAYAGTSNLLVVQCVNRPVIHVIKKLKKKQ